MNDFIPELDAYEREVTSRVGQIEAADARREMAAHLVADYEARLELGALPAVARAESLASFGDPRRIARGEPVDLRDRALLLAPGLFLLSYLLLIASVSSLNTSFSNLSILSPNMLVGCPCAVSILAGIYGARGRKRPHLRPLFIGWLAALAATPLAMIASRSTHPGESLTTLGVMGFWLGVPALVAHLLAIGVAPLAQLEREPFGAFTLRLLAWPFGMLIVGHAHFFSGLVPWVWPLTAVLFTLGMVGRRRIDFLTAVCAVVLGGLANGWGQDKLPGSPLYSTGAAGRDATWLVMLIILQVAALGFWGLLRPRPRCKGRA